MGKSKDIAWVQVDIDPKNESVVCCKHCKANERIGNPAGIGKGTGFGLRDGIGLGHSRLRATLHILNLCPSQITLEYL